MSDDKFGHFSNYTKETLKKDVPKWFGFTLDKDKNVNLQNKRLKNVRSPLEDTDAVNKAFLFAQIYNEQKILKKGISVEIARVREEITIIKTEIKNILDVIKSFNKNG